MLSEFIGRQRTSTHNSSFKPSLCGEKSMGFILSSNRLLGFNFHFLKAVQPAAAKPTIEAATMIAMRVVLLIPDLEDVVASAATEAVEEAEAVLETVVTRATVECVITVVERGVKVAKLVADKFASAVEVSIDAVDSTMADVIWLAERALAKASLTRVQLTCRCAHCDLRSLRRYGGAAR